MCTQGTKSVVRYIIFLSRCQYGFGLPAQIFAKQTRRFVAALTDNSIKESNMSAPRHNNNGGVGGGDALHSHDVNLSCVQTSTSNTGAYVNGMTSEWRMLGAQQT